MFQSHIIFSQSSSEPQNKLSFMLLIPSQTSLWNALLVHLIRVSGGHLFTYFKTSRAKGYTGPHIYFNTEMLQPVGHLSRDDS